MGPLIFSDVFNLLSDSFARVGRVGSDRIVEIGRNDRSGQSNQIRQVGWIGWVCQIDRIVAFPKCLRRTPFAYPRFGRFLGVGKINFSKCQNLKKTFSPQSVGELFLHIFFILCPYLFLIFGSILFS